jgi:hypothetical protein
MHPCWLQSLFRALAGARPSSILFNKANASAVSFPFALSIRSSW